MLVSILSIWSRDCENLVTRGRMSCVTIVFVYNFVIWDDVYTSILLIYRHLAYVIVSLRGRNPSRAKCYYEIENTFVINTRICRGNGRNEKWNQ